jgi:hypothetical protein
VESGTSASKSFLLTMNYGGEYYRVKKLNDGNYFTVGNCQATRKGANASVPGMPLLYNPSTSNPNDYFNYNDIYSGNGPAPASPDNNLNTVHWDVMKFDGNGTCLFNAIYGMNDFNDPGSFNILYEAVTAYNGITSKQHAYLSGGEAFDFIQEPGALGNVAVVGYCRSDNGYYQAALIKMDVNGNVLNKTFIDASPIDHSVARAIEYVEIAGISFYIVAVTAVPPGGSTNGRTVVKLYKIKTDLTTISLLDTYAPLYGDATAFSLSIKNKILFIPLLLDNDNSTFFSGNNKAKLNMVRYDLNNNTVLSNVFLSNVQAFDLKARTTVFANGDIGVVSSRINQSWLSRFGSSSLTTVNNSGSTPCSYMFLQNGTNCNPPYFNGNTEWWNSDAYVARIDGATGAKIWETTFDATANQPLTVNPNEFPTGASSGGGNPKHQECMYGISEAADGGIVVSGNMSANYDDNYLAKIKGDCNSNVVYHTITYTESNTNIIHYWDGAGLNPWNSNSTIKIKDELRIAAGVNVDIVNATFEFGLNGKIIIEPGAKLTMHGCTLSGSSQCNAMWQGIRVLGVYGDNAPSLNGLLILDNSCLIKNAVIGISNWDEINGSDPGGKVYAYGTKFENNKVAVEFFEDGHGAGTISPTLTIPGNRSRFEICEFKMTASKLLSPFQNLAPEIGIRLINVQDVEIKGYDATPTLFTGYSNTVRMNKAIELINSDLALQNTIFTNCSYGIKCETSVGAFYTPHIFYKNKFNNCYYSIHMRNGLNDIIEENSFNPLAGNYSHTKGSSLPNKYGIYLDGSSGFHINGNNFTNLEYAITVVNSGNIASEIIPAPNGVKNQFSNCWRGVNTIGDNSKLNIRCNTFVSSSTNAAGFHAHWFVAGKIRDQGAPQLFQFQGSPAGNTFQHAFGTDIIAVQNTASFKYYYKPGTYTIPISLGLVTILQVQGSLVCNPPDLMVLANNDPIVAEQIIENETDDEQREMFVNQLSVWYNDKGREQERIALLLAQNEEYANQQLLPLYIDYGDYHEAIDILQEYYGTNDPENDDYYSVSAMQLDWAVRGLTAFDMDIGQESTLRDIAEHKTRAAATARVIINQVFSDIYEAPYYNDTTESRKANLAATIGNTIASIAELAPNPSNDFTLVNYKLPVESLVAEFIIYDIIGQFIKRIDLPITQNQISISTIDLTSDIYFCKILCDGIMTDKMKLIVKH